MSKTTTENDLYRRDMLKRTGAVTTALGVGGMSASTTAIADDSWSPVSTAIQRSAVGLEYLTYTADALGLFLGDSRDYSGYIGADALRQEILVGVTEMKSADERVMTSIENNITNSENVALSKGKAAALEAMNAEESEQDANDAMQDAIDEYYATIQTNVLNHYKSQTAQMWHIVEQINEHEDTSDQDHFEAYTNGDWTEPGGSTSQVPARGILRNEERSSTSGTGNTITAEPDTIDYELLNGEIIEVDIVNTDYNNLHPEDDSLRIRYSYDGETVEFFDQARYVDALDAILAKRDDINANLSGFVTDVYNQYDPGDIPVDDLLDPITAVAEYRQNYDSLAGQAAHAAMLGIPTTTEFTAHLEVYPEVGSDLYDEIEGEVWEVAAELYTNHLPEDSDGNEGFVTGETYDPGEWDEPLFIAFEGEDEAYFIQLDQEFEIISVEDSDGEEVDEFQPRDTNNQTSDVAALEEEIERLREEQKRMQQDAQEENSDFAFPWEGDGLTTGMMAVGVGAIAFVFALLQTSDN